MWSLVPTQSIRGGQTRNHQCSNPIWTTDTLDKRQLSVAIPDGIFYAVRTVSWCFDHPFADSKQLRSISFEVMDQNAGRPDRHLMGRTQWPSAQLWPSTFEYMSCSFRHLRAALRASFSYYESLLAAFERP